MQDRKDFMKEYVWIYDRDFRIMNVSLQKKKEKHNNKKFKTMIFFDYILCYKRHIIFVFMYYQYAYRLKYNC